MRLTGIDRTYGSQGLISIGNDYYNSQDESGKQELDFMMSSIKEDMKSALFLNLLCQYAPSTKSRFSKGDIVWCGDLYDMIFVKKSLYVSFVRLDNWAFPDADFKSNKLNLSKAGISVEWSDGNSDGLFTIDTETKFVRWKGNKDADDNNEIMASNISGVVEFGTQMLCKSVMSLKMGDILLRVPYDYKKQGATPLAAIFMNTHDYVSEMHNEIFNT